MHNIRNSLFPFFFMLVGPIHITHQLLHILELYVLDCLLKVALPRPLRSRNLLQMTSSAQILGGCTCISLVPKSYIQYRGIRYLLFPSCCMNRTGVLDCCDVCSGLVCCMMEEGRGVALPPQLY